MITRIVRTIIVVSATASIFIVSAGLASAAQNATTIAEHIDKGKYTTSEIKSYVKELKGEQVTARGKVNNVESGKRGHKVAVYVKIPGREKDFVVDTVVDDASNLHKNDSVVCTGEFVKYNPWSLNGITLKDGKCTKK